MTTRCQLQSTVNVNTESDTDIAYSVSHLAHLGRCGLSGRGRSSGGGSRRELGGMLGGCSGDGDVLDRDAVRGDVVDLTGRGHVDQVVGLDFDLVAGRQEGVEAHDEVGVAFEELGHSADDPRGVNTRKST